MLQVKNNQKTITQDIEAYFHKTRRDESKCIDTQQIEELECEHGRIVGRQHTVLVTNSWITGIDRWAGAKHILGVVRIQHIAEQPDKQKIYYLTSMSNDLPELARVIRGYWVLDVTFREDESLIYTEDGPKNMALLKRVFINMLKANSLKDTIAGKRLRVAWNDNFRAKVMFG